MRAAAREVTGFGAGTAAGLYVGGIAYTGLIALAGPVGWGVLGAIFAVSLAAGYLASTVGGAAGEKLSDRLWELSQ